MAFNVMTANTFVSVNPFAAQNDTYYIPSGITLAANAGLISSFSGYISVDGNINVGSSGINIGQSGGLSAVNIGLSAHVYAVSGIGAIGVLGGYTIRNAGLVASDFNAIQSQTGGTIFNSGEINGFNAGISIYGGIAGTTHITNSGEIASNFSAVSTTASGGAVALVLTNTGNILGNNYSFLSNNVSTDTVTNSGTMTGDVVTGVSDDKIINYGHIYGNIDMGADNDTLYTDLSQLGPYTMTGGSGTDTLINIDNDHTASLNMADTGFEIFYGGAMASYIYGGTATAGLTFVGRGGMDAFIGGTGADVAIGGGGGDYLDGGAGSNTLSYSTSLLGVTVNLGAGTASGGDAAGDYFLNFQNLNGSAAVDVLVGDGGANTLYGDAGNDFMFGSSGADLLIGAAGNDYLSGGAGNDIFYYGATGYGNDEIVDFTIGQDTMYISTSIAANFAGLTIFQYLADTYVGAGGNYFHLDNTVATNLHASDFVFF